MTWVVIVITLSRAARSLVYDPIELISTGQLNWVESDRAVWSGLKSLVDSGPVSRTVMRIKLFDKFGRSFGLLGRVVGPCWRPHPPKKAVCTSIVHHIDYTFTESVTNKRSKYINRLTFSPKTDHPFIPQWYLRPQHDVMDSQRSQCCVCLSTLLQWDVLVNSTHCE